MTYEIVERLEKQDQIILLHQLQQAVESKDRQRNEQHEIWSDSFDWKDCRGKDFIKQKLDYIHKNSCRGKWNLANSPEDISIVLPIFMQQEYKAFILLPVTWN